MEQTMLKNKEGCIRS